MRLKLLVFSIISSLFISCKTEDTDSLNNHLSPIWEKDFQVGQTTCINPVVLDETVVFSSYERENLDLKASSRLIAYAQKDGKLDWDWRNRETDKSEDLLLSTPVYCIDNNLFFSKGPRCYAVSALTGETRWFRTFGDYAGTELIENEDKIYYLVGQDNSKRNVLVNLDLNSGDTTAIIDFYNNDSTKIHADNFLIAEDYIHYIKGYSRIINDVLTFDDYLIRYNRVTFENVYESSLSSLNIGTVQSIRKFDETSILAISNKYVLRFSTYSGKLIWSTPIPSNMFYQDFLTTDSGLWYIVTEDNLMCISIASGGIIWDVVPVHLGLNSRMVLHKGVLYFVSGGRLNAFDASNGQQIMSLLAPSIQWSGVSDNFQSVMTLDAENDRIYTASYTAAYCYPTLNLADR
jgi:hypothetical protein